MTHQRSSRPARFRSPHAWLLALGSLAIALARSGTAAAQGFVYDAYYNGPGLVGFPLVDFPMVNFPMVNFGLVDFGMVNFPLVNPLGGNQNFYYNANPYAYWDGLAAADTYRAAKYAMNSARYNVQANSLATNATAANLIDRDTYMMMLQRRNSAAPRTGDRYNVGTGRSALSGGAVGTKKLAEITTREGDVLWPLNSPVGGDLFDRRRAANQAVKGLMQTFKKQGKLPVEDVVSTLKVLREYSNPAAETLRKDQPSDAASFENFIASLDRGLRLLATSPVPDPE